MIAAWNRVCCLGLESCLHLVDAACRLAWFQHRLTYAREDLLDNAIAIKDHKTSVLPQVIRRVVFGS